MTGGSPTSGADPPPIRCSIRSVIRTFWRARARANAPDADDASGGRRYSAARYGEKRGGTKRPPAFLHTLRRRCGRCHPAVRRRRRRHGSVVGACTAAVGGRCPSGGRTACSGCRVACAACSAAAVAAAVAAARALGTLPARGGTGGSREGRGSARLGRLVRSRGRDSGATRPRPSGWRGSVVPGASGAVLGGACGGATTAMPGDRSASVGVNRRRSA